MILFPFHPLFLQLKTTLWIISRSTRKNWKKFRTGISLITGFLLQHFFFTYLFFVLLPLPWGVVINCTSIAIRENPRSLFLKVPSTRPSINSFRDQIFLWQRRSILIFAPLKVLCGVVCLKFKVASYLNLIPSTLTAEVAHLVERDLAKVEVAGSSPVFRSSSSVSGGFFFIRSCNITCPGGGIGRHAGLKIL